MKLWLPLGDFQGLGSPIWIQKRGQTEPTSPNSSANATGTLEVRGSTVASSCNLKPHGEGQLMIQRPWKRAEPFGARSWTSYSSRLVIRKSTIDYQTQLGEHLNCWKASRQERYAYRNCSLFAIHIHLFSQEGGLCKVLVASTPLMWTKMVGKMLSLLRRKSQAERGSTWQNQIRASASGFPAVWNLVLQPSKG